MPRLAAASLAMLLASAGFLAAQGGEDSAVGEPAGTSTEQDPTTEVAPASPIMADVPATTVPEGCAAAAEPGAVEAIGEGAGLPEGMPAHGRELIGAVTRVHAQLVGSLMAEDPDLAFACAMIAHHQAAINMAGVQLTAGEDEALRGTAQEIIDGHRTQVEELTAWVAENAP
jgi:hypothetical protein